jgi:shikimate kinase
VKQLERSLVLIGFMGAGKSAVGRELATQLEALRYDTDEMIRQRCGKSIDQIFVEEGEAFFRDAETGALYELQTMPSAVVVTGGGIILRKENVELLRRLGRRIWLDADEETLWQRASLRHSRPLLQGANPRERFGALLQKRLPLYGAAASDRVDTAGASIVEVAARIVELI